MPEPTGAAAAAAGPLAADARLDVGLLRPVAGLACAAVLVTLFVRARSVQRAETALSAALARATGLHDAHQLGTSVLFRSGGQTIGYGITLGCTVAFLLVPFFAATGLLLTVRRVSVARALAALAAAVAVVETVNQLRLLVIVAGIRTLGLEVGYSLTHVLVGTTLSTVGIVCAATAYLLVLTHERSHPPAPWDDPVLEPSRTTPPTPTEAGRG